MWGVGINGCPEYVRAMADASLQLLNVNVIDLYYQHLVDPDTPIEETFGALGQHACDSRADVLLAYGVALKPRTLAPSQVRLLGTRPCHTMSACPACCSTVASTASGGLAALRNAALEL